MVGQQGFTDNGNSEQKLQGLPVEPHSINTVAGNLLIHALSCGGCISTNAQLDMLKAFASSFLKMTFPCGTCSWRYILDGCTGAGIEMDRGQSGYLRVYPFLLPLRDAGATGLVGVLCPRGNTPLLQQGEPDTHKQHQESHRGTSGGGNGGKKENREQLSILAACESPAL